MMPSSANSSPRASRPLWSDSVSLPGRFASASKASSPYESILSRSSLVQPSKIARGFVFPVDPEEAYRRNVSSSASVGYLDDRRNRYRQSLSLYNHYTDPIASNYSQTYPPSRSSASLDGISSPRYRGLSLNTSRKEPDNQTVSSLGSSTRYSRKLPAPRYSKNFDATVLTFEEVRKEKLILLAMQCRDALVQDSRQFDGVIPNEVYFPTKCPRSASLQDARSRIIQMTLAWKHATLLTIGGIDNITEAFQRLKSTQEKLRKNLADKQATINLMLQQQRSLSNYLEHLRKQAHDRGLGSFVYERNPLLTKYIDEFTKERSKHPLDGQIFQLPSDSIHRTLTENELEMAKKIKKEKGAINLLDIAHSAEEEVLDGLPGYAKRILSSQSNGESTNLLDSLSLQSSQPSSRSSTPSITRNSSFSTAQSGANRSNFAARSTIPSSSSVSRLEIDQYGNDDNYEAPRPPSRIAAQRGHVLTPLEVNTDHVTDIGDNDMSHLDEWGNAIIAATPSTNTSAMAKSMALKNLSIRAMIALSPHKRIIDKANDIDKVDSFSPTDDVDRSNELDSPTSLSLMGAKPKLVGESNSMPSTRLVRDHGNADFKSTDLDSSISAPKFSASSPNKSPRVRLKPPNIPSTQPPTLINADDETASQLYSGLSLQDLANVDFISPDRSNDFKGSYGNHYGMNGHENGKKISYPPQIPSNGQSSVISNDRLMTQQGYVVQSKTPQELSMTSSPRERYPLEDYNPAGLAKSHRQPIAASYFLKSVVSAASPRAGGEHSLQSSRPTTPMQAPKRPPPRAPV